MQAIHQLKTLSKLLPFSLAFAFTTGNAQTLQRIEIDPAQPATNTSVTVLVHYTPGEPNFCGFTLDLGNGQSQSIRIGHEQDTSTPIRRTVVFNNPGNYIIRAEGRFLSRGLRSAAACSGSPQPLAVQVKDLQAERNRQSQLEAQQRAQEALKQAEEQKRQMQERELELRRKELELREMQLRQQEEQRRSTQQPTQPAVRPSAPPPPPPKPASPPPVRSVDGF
jgi:hypothetical protein